MKVIKYQVLDRYNIGTDENPDWKEGLGECVMGYNEANLKLAEQDAYNGEYTIEDDGQPEPEIPTEDDVWADMAAALHEGVDSV